MLHSQAAVFKKRSHTRLSGVRFQRFNVGISGNKLTYDRCYGQNFK
ncbi:hypothetical protein HMPREF1597_03323 [Escherichia coli 907701]|nr:hypothetical protein HMPREF1597_03323 [Escherichia coli 907701]